MSEKKFVSTIVWNADKLTNCNNLYEIRETIERLINNYGSDARIDFMCDFDYAYLDEKICFDRLETDAEYESRIKMETDRARGIEEEERKLLAHLKKKYEQ